MAIWRHWIWQAWADLPTVKVTVAMVFHCMVSWYAVYCIILVEAKLLFKKWRKMKGPCLWKRIKKASIGNRNYFFFKFCTEKISSAISCAHAIIHAVSHTAPKNTVTPRYTERHKHNYLGNKNTMCLNYLILLQVIICNVFGNWNCLLKIQISFTHVHTHIHIYK